MNTLNTIPRRLSEPTPEVYASSNYCVFDFETTNIDYGNANDPNNRIVCVTWRCGPTHPMYDGETKIQWDLNPYNTKANEEFFQALRQADFIVAHNTKFECGWLDRLGLEYWDYTWFDTMLFEYLVQGNQRRPLNLDALVDLYFGFNKEPVVKKLMDGGVCPSVMPESLLRKYALLDTDLTEMLLNVYQEMAHLFPCAYTKNLFVPVLYDLEKNGMFLDKDRVLKVYKQVAARHEDAVRRMDELTGGINFRSPKQVCEFVYGKLGFDYLKKQGQPIKSASKDVLTKLKPKTQAQKDFIQLKIELSTLEAELSKALNKFIKAIDEEDGTLYAIFSQTITQTHRLASKGKEYNLQFHNMPKKFKPLFKARKEGWKIVEADLAQLEFRAAVQMAQDKQGISDVANGVDVHMLSATTLSGCKEEDVTKQIRDKFKAETFKPLYGGTKGTPKQMAYYEAFRKKYPDIAEMQAGWADTVLSTKELELVTGLTFYWPECTMYNSGYIKDTPSIYNYPIQYLATGEVVPIAVIHQWYRMKQAGMESFLVNTIHDSTVGEVHPDEMEQYEEIIQQAYIEDVYQYLEKCYGIEWTVPLEVESEATEHWIDSEAWKQQWLGE